jgi:tetratricopeptide (TPR) repeat protein
MNCHHFSRYQQLDPALLEWVDGSTFKMRVFPLEPRQEKRIILSYTQRLPALYGQASYRFPAGHSLQTVRRWSFHARVKNGADLTWASPSHRLRAIKKDGDLLLNAAANNARFDRDVVLNLAAKDQQPLAEAVRFSSAEHEGARYLMLGYRPGLKAAARRQRRDWVFLFESSGDRDPLLARAQVEVIRHLLGQAEPDDTFTVLTAGTRVRAFSQEPRPVTPANVKEAVAFLEGAHLIGALDLGRALTEAAAVLQKAKAPYLVHVGSGIAAMGERRPDVLVKRLPPGTRYVGVGVGRRWNRALMKAAAEKSGGFFSQINPDESIAWRSFELAATLNTPRLLNVRVVGSGGDVTFLPFTDSLAQGEELGAIARLGSKEKALPKTVVVTGSLNGKAFERVLPVKDVAAKADYLPRTWAQLEIERLLAENARRHKKQLVTLSKAMYVMTPFTSLLVLENEDMYKQYKVDRGRKDHWAMYPLPRKIKVVTEDDQAASRKGRKPAAQVLETIQVRQPIRFLTSAGSRRGQNGRGEFYPSFVDFQHYSVHGLPTEQGPTGHYLKNSPQHYSPGLDFPIALEVPAFEKIALIKSKAALRQRAKLLGIRRDDRDSYLTPLPRRHRAGLQVFIAGNDVSGRRQVEAIEKLAKAKSRELGNVINTVGYKPPEPALANLRAPDDIDAFIARQLENSHPSNLFLLYQRPGYSGNDRLFYDLLAYAPGLNTSPADVRAVLAAEALPDPDDKPGHIDDDARRLFAKARSSGWQALTVPARGKRPAYTMTFNGKGQYAYDRVLPFGLRERVVCNGKSLLHLYPDLGLAGRRRVSRFHRMDFSDLVHWALPRAADLAHGADLKVVAERTVALIPHGAARKTAKGKPVIHYRVHFVFAADGRLAERQIVRMPAGKTISRETYSADGVVKVLDARGKEIATIKFMLKGAPAADLKADTKQVVVLPLPFRTREHILQARKIQKTNYRDLRFKDALALLAADVAAGNTPEAANVFNQAFHARDQRQLGLYVLLAASGQNLDADHIDVMAEHEETPLAQYLALHSSPVLRKHASQWAVGSRQWQATGFLQHLAVSHALFQRWANARVVKGNPAKVRAERARAVKYVRANQGSVFGWALLCLMQDRAGKDKAFHRELSELWPLFRDVLGLEYSARYEQARCLWKAGQGKAARKHFRELYQQTLRRKRLPPIDADFREALLKGDGEIKSWGELMRQTGGWLVEHQHRPAVLALARQCWQLGDEPLANHPLGAALKGKLQKKERLALTLERLRFQWETGQLAWVDAGLRKLLTDPKLARRAALWRLGVKLAEERDQKSRALECLERALECESRRLPKVINLPVVRQDYGKLLGHYQELADALVTLKKKPPADFVAKVLRAADCWRALDREEVGQACQAAGRILQTLGERDLSWDYLTTPVGLRPNEAAPWRELAGTLGKRGDLELADRAYRAACEAEPTNAEFLWERIQNLRAAGKTVAAAKVLRRLAEGKWQPRFQSLQAQARWQFRGRH